MAAGVGTPYYGVEITDFNDLVVGQTYKLGSGTINSPFHDGTTIDIIQFLGTEPTPSGSIRYRFRKLTNGFEFKLQGYDPGWYRVYQHSTGGARRQKKTRRQNKRRGTRRRAYRK